MANKIPPEITQILDLVNKLEASFSADSKRFEYGHAIRGNHTLDFKDNPASQAFFEEKILDRILPGLFHENVYSWSGSPREYDPGWGWSGGSPGGSITTYSLFVRPEDLPVYKKVIEAELELRQQAELDATKAREKRKLLNVFKKNVATPKLVELFGFNADLAARTPKQLTEEASLVVALKTDDGVIKDKLALSRKKQLLDMPVASSDMAQITEDDRRGILVDAADKFAKTRKLGPTLQEFHI